MRLDNLFRFDYWLDASVVNQPAGRAIWLAVVVGLIGCVVAGWLWQSRRTPRDLALAWIVAGGLVSLIGISRIFAIPLVGLRIGWLIAVLVALAPIMRRLARDVRRDGLIRDCLDAMAFAPQDAERQTDWRRSITIAWLVFHLFSLAVIFANINLPIIYAPALLLVILAPVLASSIITSHLSLPTPHSPIITHSLSCLAPLTLTYLTALLDLLGVHIEGMLNGLLYVPLSLIVMSAYAFAISGRFAASMPSRARDGDRKLESGDWRFVQGSAMALVVATLAWAAWAALTLHTHGVTGSDPYAYAQMGVDLAMRGTVFHAFPLARLTYALDIPSHPIVHVGYRIPDGINYEAATVWPPGYALFTGAAYLLAGERGLYLVTPLFNLIALGTVAWFAWQVADCKLRVASDRLQVADKADQAPPDTGRDAHHATLNMCYALIALTVFFTATSYQQVEWQMTPMADIAAQLFSILALTLALRARGSLLMAGLSGLVLGVAFDIRYTQVLMAPAIALALALSGCSTSDAGRTTIVPRLLSRVSRLAVCALAALIAALPVLAYHQIAFGSPFVTGSEELAHFSLARLPETALRTLSELNHYREFGLLTPLILIGVAAMWRRNRRGLAVFAVYFVTLLLFHVAYAYLRLRDILFLFPVLHFLTALGVVELWHTAFRISRFSILRRLLTITTICTLSFLFVLRAMETLALPTTRGFNSFGYLLPQQRASFDHLRRITPPDAVIGSTLNSGAIDLYAQRLAFRPEAWQPDELTRFVDRLHEEGRPVYVLNDGEELRSSLRTLRQRYAVHEVDRVDVPYYEAVGGGSENRRVALFKIEPQK